MEPLPIRLARMRSLALHRRVAERLREEPELVAVASRRVAGWLQGDQPSRPYLERWRSVLERPLEDLLAVLVEESEAADELRAASPFAGLVDPRERWAIWARTREAVVSERR
ncbi:MAG: hypothetical protein FJZ01_22715 [Candidatus Sericytochromatia bacterium]|nr:hypothetical protein [Candidatus Tanganyikabacteria bacterium]